MRNLRCGFSVAFLLLATACVSIVGGPGGIAPAQFHFSPIVSLKGRGPGGWKMARLIITLARVSEGGVHNVPCRVQVEVPETNFLGTVDDGLAEAAAAEAADAAAELVLPQGLVSAVMCERFRQEMQKLLSVPVPGARVRDFIDM
ncbi:hypothetical protein [Hyalangium versicolor]|uniref:hypothetical protein n=1 Tax=Hyalangium versicolor TaxID=2861190 RepID=UPI001CCF4344|nr:hypothetical protein [Hyalangium versicolor]